MTRTQIEIDMLASQAAYEARKVSPGPWATLARAAAQSAKLAVQKRTAIKHLQDVRYYAARAASAQA